MTISLSAWIMDSVHWCPAHPENVCFLHAWLVIQMGSLSILPQEWVVLDYTSWSDCEKISMFALSFYDPIPKRLAIDAIFTVISS